MDKYIKENNLTAPWVSVIMPVYNAAKTLEKSVESVLNQTYPHIELILVNDASQDDSLSKMKHIQHHNDTSKTVVIITHEKNLGVAASRNTGISLAQGKYIYWVDADDHLELDAIESLVQLAEDTGSDVVGCGWYLSFSESERKMPQAPFSSGWDALEKLAHGVMRWNLWLFMVRKELFDDTSIRFTPQMNMGEDMMLMFKILSKAGHTAFLNKPLYHYTQANDTSLTRTYSEQHRTEVTNNVHEVARFLYQHFPNDTSRIGELIGFLKLNIKLPLLFTGNIQDYRIWQQWFKEANVFIMKNKMLPLRTKLLQWCATQGWYLPIKLYNILVVKIVYGFIYK